MENDKAIKHLTALAQLDIDASSAYDQAIKNIDDPETRDQITMFKMDHERHISDLSSMILKLGGEPPQRKSDLKGFFIGGFTRIRSSTGTEGALKAMRMNEMLTNRTYKEATEQDFDNELKMLIEANYNDERRHLEYIENALQNRSWEKQRSA